MADQLKAAALIIGGKYNWKNQAERLIYMGLCEPRNGHWHQFALIESPTVVWCEVLPDDLDKLEVTQDRVKLVGVPTVQAGDDYEKRASVRVLNQIQHLCQCVKDDAASEGALSHRTELARDKLLTFIHQDCSAAPSQPVAGKDDATYSLKEMMDAQNKFYKQGYDDALLTTANAGKDSHD